MAFVCKNSECRYGCFRGEGFSKRYIKLSFPRGSCDLCGSFFVTREEALENAARLQSLAAKLCAGPAAYGGRAPAMARQKVVEHVTVENAVINPKPKDQIPTEKMESTEQEALPSTEYAPVGQDPVSTPEVVEKVHIADIKAPVSATPVHESSAKVFLGADRSVKPARKVWVPKVQRLECKAVQEIAKADPFTNPQFFFGSLTQFVVDNQEKQQNTKPIAAKQMNLFKNCKKVTVHSAKKVVVAQSVDFPAEQIILTKINANQDNEVITKIVKHDCDQVCDERSKPTWKQSRKRVKPNIVRCKNERIVENLMAFTQNIMKKRDINVCVIGRQPAYFNTHVRSNKKEYFAMTNHQIGKFKRTDLPNEKIINDFVRLAAEKNHAFSPINEKDITFGDSGLIIHHDRLNGRFEKHGSGALVVRGRESHLVDARSELTPHRIQGIEHYSKALEQRGALFWDSLNANSTKYKKKDVNHNCENTYDIEESGLYLTLLVQMLQPCGKIGCEDCHKELSQMSADELSKAVVNEQLMQAAQTKLRGYRRDSLNNLAQIIHQKCSSIAVDFDIVKSITLATNGKTQSPFTHIQRVADELIRAENGNEGLSHLLEITRWIINKLKQSKELPLQFKNKISSKAHANFALLCDNQLNQNGVFQWGERGVHAKRFFSRYHDIITSSAEYEKYKIRKHIRGERCLAIKNLLVSSDFHQLRKSLKGEQIAFTTIGEQCFTRLNGEYLYNCCCVTLDNGQPLLSNLKLPTQNHLVIGNTGDSKLVELPEIPDGGMYIAKEGYCYINIFLAMLVNIQEENAKDFTKRVRDSIIEKLGKWPTMKDVATACYYIAAYFPSVRTAELPRIFIDHENKTMHVIDAFGSMNTGYHILKAGTVEQLFQFASDDNTGELQNYNVGGDYWYPQNFNCSLKEMEAIEAEYERERRSFHSQASAVEDDIDIVEEEEEEFSECEDPEVENHEIEEISDDSTNEGNATPSGQYRQQFRDTWEKQRKQLLSAEAENGTTERQTESEELHEMYDNPNERPQTETEVFRILMKAVFNKEKFEKLVKKEPYILLIALISPSAMRLLYKDGLLTQAINMMMGLDEDMASLITYIHQLSKNVTMAEAFDTKMHIISMASQNILDKIDAVPQGSQIYKTIHAMLHVSMVRHQADYTLAQNGFFLNMDGIYEKKEDFCIQIINECWSELTLYQKLSYSWQRRNSEKLGIDSRVDERFTTSRETWNGYISTHLKASANGTKTYAKTCLARVQNKYQTAKQRFLTSTIVTAYNCLPDVIKVVNVLIITKMLIEIYKSVGGMLKHMRETKEQAKAFEEEQIWRRLMIQHKVLSKELGEDPTEEEFINHLKRVDPMLADYMEKYYAIDVSFQAGTPSTRKLESAIAATALVMMIFDSNRCDILVKILNKLKTIFAALNFGVRFEALDDILQSDTDNNLTVDFEITTNERSDTPRLQTTFNEFWQNQMNCGRTVPHYRSNGTFIEFSRDKLHTIAHTIDNIEDTDLIIRGAVGSGKSTGIPSSLMLRGAVLLIEPTRPLTENVAKQLMGAPFHLSPTVMMRGKVTFGSSPITVMTTGYALHYLANNINRINNFKYIMFDECHVMDANAMALYCLLKDNGMFKGKILKVSATPPGRESEFTTQFPVTLNVETALSFDEFVDAQGTSSNACVTSKGDNILVYVASYNDVDTLSRKLTSKGFKVTKVDGRTMKLGATEIITEGTQDRKHFIVATNIIENGVTLNIDVVVDFGMKVTAQLDADNRMMNFTRVPITFGERIQRMGRVGRIKNGHCLKIGHTEKGLPEIPQSIATEAAFYSFVYDLPVMTGNVVTSSLGNCTRMQAKTMSQFELPIFYTLELVKENGAMHPEIYKHLKKYVLRDTQISLEKTALPFSGISRWLTVNQYNRLGAHITTEIEGMRIPFYTNNVPDKLNESIWDTCLKYKSDVTIRGITTSQAHKIALVLQTDVASIPRTVGIIDKLIEHENVKHNAYNMFNSCANGATLSSLENIISCIRSRYLVDHYKENIEILNRARSQILEFKNLNVDVDKIDVIQAYPYLSTVEFQGEDEVAQSLNLKGKFDKSKIATDVLLGIGTLVGGSLMLWQICSEQFNKPVEFQGWKRKERQIRFKKAKGMQEMKMVWGDDETMQSNFGEAYTSKEKRKGKTHGMGRKENRFYYIYGFDPSDYDTIRFLDPLTGATIDIDTYVLDVVSAGEQLREIRNKMIASEEIDSQMDMANKRIKAYVIKTGAKIALELDLTPHNPFLVQRQHDTIAGYPDKEGQLRQTGMARQVDISCVPKPHKPVIEDVVFESKAVKLGPRSYTPQAEMIVMINAFREGGMYTIHGIGYGPYILTNSHFFQHEHTSMVVHTLHGKFTVEDMKALSILKLPERDLAIIRMPKDFPPFSRRLQFRYPVENENILLLKANFNERIITPAVSEVCGTNQYQNTHFWKHTISTKLGYCGLPLVATKDGEIVGIHSLGGPSTGENYYVSMPSKLIENFIDRAELHEWTHTWMYNPETISWGNLRLQDSTPGGMFKVTKAIGELLNLVTMQGLSVPEYTWLTKHIGGNLKLVGTCPGQLITKHVVKGKDPLFQTFLSLDSESKAFFEPLCGHYGKSNLNKAACVKDFTKYSSDIIVGNVKTDVFEEAFENSYEILVNSGIIECDYVNDTQAIFDSLNMKAAVGTLYGGKKKDYFADFSEEDKAQIIMESCERLYYGKLGIWNCSLKAELRCREKIEANKTRTFTAAPLETLLGGKVCVDDFNNQFYECNLKGPWTVGISKFYGGWNKMLNKLPDNWIYCDADGSRFDSSLTPYLINAVLRMRLRFMEPWDIGERMLRNLYTEITYTPIATPDGSVIKKFKGNNSGQPSTVVDNTMMVMFTMQYALLRTGIQFQNQDEKIVYLANGDDLLIAVHPDYVHILDEFEKIFKELGLNYDFSSRTKNKEEVWFMSHRGKLIDGMYIPKLEMERIVAILEWDRSTMPENRLEAICAAMIEAWGYDELIMHIRKFYKWVLDQYPYADLVKQGKAPYLAETALTKLYTNVDANEQQIEEYVKAFGDLHDMNPIINVRFEGDSEDAARLTRSNRDKDVTAGTSGTFTVPRMKAMSTKMKLPKFGGNAVMNLEHLLIYKPEQEKLFNTIATQQQFEYWYENLKAAYDKNDEEMKIILNGLMVWCIENGTSPDLSGNWVMMDGDEQVEFPLIPVLKYAQPTFRQIMAHFSDAAEAYIVMRNAKEPYMPRYGIRRNLTDRNLARTAFDFHISKSDTSTRAREASIQMKAAAVKGKPRRLFGLDANVGANEENTERHTSDDVNETMHNLNGVRI
nr:polyprotein [Iris severe mosaic virus]